MADIGFSRPKGRVQVIFPDAMGIDELAETLALHLSIIKAAKGKAHNPPVSGFPKGPLQSVDDSGEPKP